MTQHYITRREFIQRTGMATGALLIGSAPGLAQVSSGRSAADQVALGRTGLKLSRLGFGTGPNNGRALKSKGQQAFTRLVRHAFDRGITFFDCAESYETYDMLGDAIKDLPREKLFIQSKTSEQPQDLLRAIDRQRSVFKTDYVDSLLVHCMTRPDWTDSYKRLIDVLDEAKEKQWIKAKGVSCHTLPALNAGVASEFPDVHLVRVNPQGAFMDGERDGWGRSGTDIDPVLANIRTMHEKGRGVIGMKIFGNGTFTDPAEREKSVRFALSRPDIDAIVIGFNSADEVDEAIRMVDAALAA